MFIISGPGWRVAEVEADDEQLDVGQENRTPYAGLGSQSPSSAGDFGSSGSHQAALEAELRALKDANETLKAEADRAKLEAKDLEQKCEKWKLESESLKEDLAEAAVVNQDLERQLVTLKDNNSELGSSHRSLESEVARLRLEAEQDRRNVEELRDIVRKKNVALSQMKINEERLELDINRRKNVEADLVRSLERFNLIKKSLEQLFSRDENFFGENEAGDRSNFVASVADEDVCVMINTVFDDYVSGKRKHLVDLYNFNNKIVKLDAGLTSELMQKNRQVSEMSNMLRNLREEFSKIEDVKKENDDLEKKGRTSEASVMKVMQQLVDLKARTEKVTDALKSDLARKNQTITSLKQELIGKAQLADTLKDDLETKNQNLTKLKSELSSHEVATKQHLSAVNKLHLLIAHSKRNLAASEAKVADQEKLINLLQRQNDELKSNAKAPDMDLILMENDELKRELKVQSQRLADIMAKVEEMKTKVNVTMAEKEAEISSLQFALQSNEAKSTPITVEQTPTFYAKKSTPNTVEQALTFYEDISTLNTVEQTPTFYEDISTPNTVEKISTFCL